MGLTTLQGVSFVITGVIPGYRVRDDFGAELTQHGAHQQKAVTRDTDVLILGEKVGAKKINDAAAKGVQTITWQEARALMNGAAAPAPAPAVTPTPASQITAPPKRNAPARTARQVNPMLCKKADELPRSGDWLYEIKWDGWRGVAHGGGDGVVLASRGGKDLSRYTAICEELQLLENAMPFILDGEIVVLDENGHSSIESLQKNPEDAATFVVFDVIELLGSDIRSKPLRERRELLEELLDQLHDKGGRVKVSLSPVFEEDERDELLEYASQNELEGIVAKKVASRYREGSRSDWLKIKLRPEQEFVVVGFTPGEGARAGVPGSALLAVNGGTKARPKWVYCGQVGTGGTYDDWADLEASATKNPAHPFLPPEATRAKSGFTAREFNAIEWVEPTVVVQVQFATWTEAGVLTHTALKGVRDDKNPKEVVRET